MPWMILTVSLHTLLWQEVLDHGHFADCLLSGSKARIFT